MFLLALGFDNITEIHRLVGCISGEFTFASRCKS